MIDGVGFVNHKVRVDAPAEEVNTIRRSRLLYRRSLGERILRVCCNRLVRFKLMNRGISEVPKPPSNLFSGSVAFGLGGRGSSTKSTLVTPWFKFCYLKLPPPEF